MTPTNANDAEFPSVPTWEQLLDEWQRLGMITEADSDAMRTRVVDEIWACERKGYALGRAYRGRQQHGR